MYIRKAAEGDLPRMMEIYAVARRFMAAHGNPNQWGPTNWPPEERIRADIAERERRQEARLRQLRPAVDRTPTVRLGELGDSAIVLTVRAWVKSSDFWIVFYDYNEAFYDRLPKSGASFPFPQLDVHISKP